MTKCRLCQSSPIDDRTPAFDVCHDCADKLGVVPLGPPRRPARGCDRCNCMKFVRVIPRELSATGNDYVQEQAAPMSLTLEPELVRRILFKGNDVSAPDPKRGRGTVETYVCTQCGFMEWYCQQPAAIPLGPEYMADIVDYNATAPYR